MKPKGLLSPAEARAAIEAGYEEPWIIYLAEPTRPPRHETFPRMGVLARGWGPGGGDRWCLHTPAGGDMIPFDDPIGLEPVGWLPMAACPKYLHRQYHLMIEEEWGTWFTAGQRHLVEDTRGGVREVWSLGFGNSMPIDRPTAWKPVTWPAKEG